MIKFSDSLGWHLKEHAHHNGGAEFFGYTMRCVEQPRLTRFDRYQRSNRSVTSTWAVDGNDVADLEAAIAALNVPPAFSADELAAISKASEEWQDLRRTWDHDMMHAITEKSAIEWSKGRCRLTDIGRAAIAAKEAGKS